MKWKNKGHEFDEYYENMRKIQTFYLFGAGDVGIQTLNILKEQCADLQIGGLIDNNPQKQNTRIEGIKVLPLQAIDLQDKSIGIILTTAALLRPEISKQLLDHGFDVTKRLFTMEQFLTVYFAYARSEVLMPHISFLPTTRCNLNCQACLNFTPYIQNPTIRSLETLKEDIDCFFSCIDYIIKFHISGGEPLLYPYLGELVEYIDNYYGKKIFRLRIVTNGSVIPSRSLLEVLARHQVDFTVDDYRQEVPLCEKNYEKVTALLAEYHISYSSYKLDQWIDLAPMTTCHKEWSENDMMHHFEECNVPYQELRGKKLYSCNYASFAIEAGLATEEESETFDLANYDKSQMKELVEFRLRYNEKGYTEFCRRCSGFVDHNPNMVPPAKQAERRSLKR